MQSIDALSNCKCYKDILLRFQIPFAKLPASVKMGAAQWQEQSGHKNSRDRARAVFTHTKCS